MKRITAILLAALLVIAMAMPVFADEETTNVTDTGTAAAEEEENIEDTASEGNFSYDAENGTITGTYESDGNVNIYVDGQAYGASYINVKVEEGEHVVDIYVNGKKVDTETVNATAAEEPAPEDPGQEEPVDPTPADSTPADPTTPEKPADNSGSTTPSKTPASNVPKTGDAENMGTFMVLGLGAALTLAAAKRVKSR